MIAIGQDVGPVGTKTIAGSTGQKTATAAKLPQDLASSGANLGPAERWISLAAGGMLLARGFRRPTLPGLFAAAGGGYMLYRGFTGRCALYRALGIHEARQTVDLQYRMTVRAPRDEVYGFCRDMGNWPAFVRSVTEVSVHGTDRAWFFLPMAGDLGLLGEIALVDDQPGHSLIWHVRASFPTAESVHQALCPIWFSDADGGGTTLEILLRLQPAGGLLGQTVAWAMRSAVAHELRGELRRLRRLLEARTAAVGTQPTESNRGSEVEPGSPPQSDSAAAVDEPYWETSGEENR